MNAVDPRNPRPIGLTPADYAALAAGKQVHVVRCVECDVRIPAAERDAAQGHAPAEPRCYTCGRNRHLGTTS